MCRIRHGGIDGKLHIILTNKEIHDCTEVSIDLSEYDCFQVEQYVLDNSGTEIRKVEKNVSPKNGQLKLILNPLTVNHLVISSLR